MIYDIALSHEAGIVVTAGQDKKVNVLDFSGKLVQRYYITIYLI